jgi:hypothetical protein
MLSTKYSKQKTYARTVRSQSTRGHQAVRIYYSDSMLCYASTLNRGRTVTYRPKKLPNLIEWADPDEQYKPHQILYQLKFGGDYDKARAFILNNYLNAESNYIRVGVKYFKEIRKLNRFGIELKDIVLWNKESIVDDFGSRRTEARKKV